MGDDTDTWMLWMAQGLLTFVNLSLSVYKALLWRGQGGRQRSSTFVVAGVLSATTLSSAWRLAPIAHALTRTTTAIPDAITSFFAETSDVFLLISTMVLAVALWEVSNVHVRIVRRQVVRRRAATFAWAVVLAVLCLRISAATMPRTPTNPWTCVAFVVYATTFIPITLAFLVMGGRLLNNILHRRVFSRLSSAEQRSRKLLAQRIRWCGVATLSFTILQICYVVGVAQQRPLEDDYMYITTMGSHLAANVLIFAQVVCVRTYSDADRRRPTMSAYVGPPRVVVSSPEPPPTKCLHGAASCIS